MDNYKIKYKEKIFSDYVELMYHIIRSDNEIDPRLFPNHFVYFVRYALQEKFNKKFTLKEVSKLLAAELALGTITLYDEKESKECI